MIKLFIDTEFTDFYDSQLISIGIVADTGEEFYMESTDFLPHRCNDFVEETVIPLLQGGEVCGSEADIRDKLFAWLNLLIATHATAQDGLLIVYDFLMDWTFFETLTATFDKKSLLIKKGASLSLEEHLLARYPEEVDRHIAILVLEAGEIIHDFYTAAYETSNARQHHALEDAKTLKQAWKNSEAWFHKAVRKLGAG